LALAAVAVAIVIAGTTFANAGTARNSDVIAWCKAAQRPGHNLSDADRAWAEQCVRVLTAGKSPVGPVSPSPTQGTPPPPPPAPQPPAPQPPNPVPPKPGGGFPDATNTGVPATVTLTPYTGQCTITAANTVIENKIVNCDVQIKASGVQIIHSKVNGFVSDGEGDNPNFSFSVTESVINGSPDGPRTATTVGADNFKLIRSEVLGGNRGVYCRRNCLVQDNWIHGTKITGVTHASGIRASQGSTIVHNTIACDTKPLPPDGGCSADLTMYGDFEAVANVHVENNLFVGSLDAAFCTYGGSSGIGVKPFAKDAHDIVFLNNTFQRGPARTDGRAQGCAAYGPVGDFDAKRPGNKWSGNVWQGSTEAVNP
jgi:hypothetical protein